MSTKVLVIISVLALLFVSICFGCFVVSGSGTYTTESIENYYDFTSHNENGIKSDLHIFPKEISNNTEEVKYYYSFSDTFLDTTYQIYLDCVYEDDEFKKEQSRIESLTYDSVKIKYDSENFNLPAYVSRLGYDNTSEYALIDKQTNRIIYVYLQFAKSKDIGFDSIFLPKGYNNYGECDNNYSLY